MRITHVAFTNYNFTIVSNKHTGLQVYKERHTIEEKQVTNLDLQIYNCQVAMLELSHYELRILHSHTTHFQYSDDRHVYVYKYTFKVVQMYIYRTRIYEC